MNDSGPLTNEQLQRRRDEAVPRGPFHVAPFFVSRAKGALLWDVEGRQYIDFCGGLGVANVGHNHPRVVAAVREQVDRFLHACFHVAMYEPYVVLAERLNELVPIAGPCKTALFNSGAEAVENAVKISRVFTTRPAVVSFERGFHGRTLLGMSLTGKCKPYTAGFGPFAPEVYRLGLLPFFASPKRLDEQGVEQGCVAALQHLAAYHVEPEAVACVVVEPVLGEGGFFPLRPAAFNVLRRWCDEHGIVLVADEVQSGFGRCGALFACERYGVEPDLITMGKSMAGGMVLSGVTGRADIMEAPAVGGIGGTYGGNPVACAAAAAVLDVLTEEKLCERARSIGEAVLETFSKLAAEHDFVGDTRGLGAMCALELVDPATGAPDAARANRIVDRALGHGLLLMTASGNIVRTLMPLVMDDELLGQALEILSAAIAEEAAAGVVMER